jgi:hypothetical protein
MSTVDDGQSYYHTGQSGEFAERLAELLAAKRTTEAESATVPTTFAERYHTAKADREAKMAERAAARTTPTFAERTAAKAAADKVARTATPTVALLADRSRLHAQAIKALDDNLNPGETVQVIITGAFNQAIIGTECRAFVYKKGFMAGASFGSEMTSFDYRNLVGVQLHKGMLSGAVILQGPGMNGQSTNYWKHTDNSPSNSPNAIPITTDRTNATQAGVARLRQLIATAQRPAPTAAVVAQPALSIADELRKLSDLRAAGVLSDDEFAALKSALLKS